MKSGLIQISQKDISRLTHKAEPMALLFMTEWCGECQIAESILGQMRKELCGRVSMFKIDTDKEPDLKIHYGIHQLPTLLISDNHQSFNILEGVNPRSRIKSAIEEILEKK